MNKILIDTKHMDKYNIKEFKANGFDCRIREFTNDYDTSSTYLCGYIKIPEDNSLYGYDYDEINIECSRNINYAEVETNGYWIGFDCNTIEKLEEPLNKEFVMNELISIASQLIEIENNNNVENVK